MATYYVDGNSGNDSASGSTSAPWRTLAKANSATSPGDTVRVRSAVYHEQITISKANVTWQADTGHTPILDGGWGPSLRRSDGSMPSPTAGMLPTDYTYGSMILIAAGANGVRVEGFTLRNLAGAGIGCDDADDVIIRNNRIDWTRQSSIKVNAGSGYADRVLIEGNNCTRAALVRLGSYTFWPGQVNIGHARNSTIRNNVIGYSMGEGINIHRGAVNCTVENNIVHTARMPTLYIQRSTGTIFRNNIVYHLGPQENIDYGEGSGGIVIGDEAESASGFPDSANSTIEGNLVINTRILFNIANNEWNYDTYLTNTSIRYNTFVGGPHTALGGAINLAPNQFGHPHSGSTFADNIIVGVPAGGYLFAGGGLSGITIGRNCWQSAPSAVIQGAGDVYADAQLVNRSAPLQPFNVSNYYLRSTSPARGIAAGGTDAGAFQYGTVDPPSPDDPPDDELPPLVGTAFSASVVQSAQQIVDGTVTTEVATITLDAAGKWGGLRFTGLNIPPESTIHNAFLTFTPTTADHDSPNIEIDLQAHDNAPALAATPNLLSGMTLTGEEAVYNGTDVGHSRRVSPSFTAAMQALVDRAGWVAGNAATVVLKSLAGSDLVLAAFGSEGPTPPVLYIYYTPLVPVPGDPIAGITVGTDDGQEEANGTVNISGISVNMVQTSDRIALVFRDLPIPPGSAVTSARVSGFVPSTSYDDVHCRIRLQNSPDAPTLTPEGGSISARPVMAESVTWDALGLGTGWKDTPDLSALFQALFAQPGWVSGNNACVIFESLSNRYLRFHSFENSAGNKPQLYLEFTPPDEPEPPPDEPDDPDPAEPLVQHYTSRHVAYGETDPNNEYTLPDYPIRRRPDQLLILVIHAMQPAATDEAFFTVDFGGFDMGAPFGQSRTTSSADGMRYITVLNAFYEPPPGTGDIIVTSSTAVDQLVLSAETLKLRGNPGGGMLFRQGYLTWDEGDLWVSVDDVLTGDFILMAHTSHSGGAPTFGYTPGVERYGVNSGDDDEAIAAGSAYHYMTQDLYSFDSQLIYTAGTGLPGAAAAIVAIRSTVAVDKSKKFVMAGV